MVAEVIINSNVKNLNKTFDYNVPAELAGTIKLGDRILVPFGNSRNLEEGFVVGLKENSQYKIKDIAGIQEGFSLSEYNINLAKWIAKRYFCNISDAIKMMLPPGTSTKNIENRIKEKSLNFVYLKKDVDEIELCIQNKKIKSDKHIRTLRFLEENDGVLTTDLESFCDVSRAIINTLEKNGYIEIIEKQVERNPFLHKVIKQDSNLKLTNEQEQAYKKIENSMDNGEFKEFLIYGVTGSRKNRNIFTAYKKSNRKK
jgi:primosomal protein N' (replication factor Y)